MCSGLGLRPGCRRAPRKADLLSIAMLSHGDTKHLMLLPASVAECFEFAGAAFDLTEQLQTPVFVMCDLDMA